MDKRTVDETIGRPERAHKPSRWLIAVHLCGGICLNTFLDVSGLSKLFLDSAFGSDPASASSYAAGAALVAVTALAIGYFLSKSLVNAIDSGAIRDRGKSILRIILPFAYFASAIILAMATDPLIASPKNVSISSPPTVQRSDMKPVVVWVISQSAEGMTEADLDLTMLKILQDWMVETILQKAESKFSAMGYDPKNFKPDISASSIYATVGGKKLAVIKITIDNSLRSVTILGITGNQLDRVTCLRASNQDIPVWSGVCGDEVQKTFGVSIHPRGNMRTGSTPPAMPAGEPGHSGSRQRG